MQLTNLFIHVITKREHLVSFIVLNYSEDCEVRKTDHELQTSQVSTITEPALKLLAKSGHGYVPAEVITSNESLPSTSAFFVDSNEPTATHLTQCKVQCCQDSLEVYQVTDPNVHKSTKKVQGHARQFNADWYKVTHS